MQHRRLEPGEGELEARVPHRPREGEPGRVARGGQALDLRSAGIAQAEQRGDFVERLTGGVVARRSQEPVAPPGGHVEQQRVAPRDEQRHEWRLELGVLDQGGEEVTLEMVDADQGAVARVGERLGVHHADEQRAHETWSRRDRDGVHGVPPHTRLNEGALHHGRERGEVRAARELRHHASEYAMHVLRQDHEARELGARPLAHEQRRRGLVARRLDPEHDVSHGRASVWEEPAWEEPA